MEEGAEGLEKIATTDDTQQLPPGPLLDDIGAEIPPPHQPTEGQSGFCVG